MKKSVSIILPVYNVEKYIVDCVESIIRQSNKDFELVIVNDGTKDNSIELAVKVLSGSDVDYRIINRENGGLSAARNTGIREAVGDYLAFVDSDDVIHPDYVSTLLGDVKRNKVQLAIANYKEVAETTKFEFDQRICTGRIVDKKDFLNKILKRVIFNYFGCFLTSRKYILTNNLWFDENVFFGVDQAYMWRLMVGVDKYTYNEKCIYNYFERQGSIMTATTIKKMLTGLPSLEKCAEEISDNPYFNSELIVERWKISALHTIAKQFEFKQFDEACKQFKPNKALCFKYPDFRIKAISIAILLGDKTLYNILRGF